MIERGEIEVMSRVKCLVLRIENSDGAKVGYSDNERIGKVQIDDCMRMENRHESFGPI